MSKLVATVDNIKNVDNLNIISFKCCDTMLSMMSLDIDSQIKKGTKVLLGCKPSSVALAKDFSGTISFSNKLESNVIEIQRGELLCMVKLKHKEFYLESLLTRTTVDKMDLKEGEVVTAFIKASELSILEILDD